MEKFKIRRFFTLLIFFSFLLMTISGLVLYFTPQGRIAYWVEWKFMGLTKDGWTDLHTVSWFLFLISSIFHIYYNWKPLINYFKGKIKEINFLSKEGIISILITLFLIFSGIFKIPPLGLLIDLNDYIKDSYSKKPNYEPPFGHAEEISLKVLAKRLNIDLIPALEELKKNGIKFKDENSILKDIAKENSKTPRDIYNIISKFIIEKDKKDTKSYTPESVEEEFSGTGIGRKTLKFFCEENGIDLELAKNRLNLKGINMKEEDNFRSVADKYETTPIEIVKLILVEDYNLKK